MMSLIPLSSCHCAVNIHVILEETKWIQAKYHQLTWINSLISPINSALENCSSLKRTEARTNLEGKENHSKSLFRRHSYLSAQFFMRITNFLYTFSRFSERFLISTLLAILRISIQNKQLRPKIIKHTFKQLKRIWPKLTLNIKINKRKLLSKQQKDAAYMTSILIITLFLSLYRHVMKEGISKQI